MVLKGTARRSAHAGILMGFLVSTGKQQSSSSGAGTWWGGGAFGRLAGSLRSAGYAGEVDIVWSRTSTRSRRRPDRSGRKARLSMPVYVAKAESDFGCRRKWLLGAEGCATVLRVHGPSSASTSRPVSGTRLVTLRQWSTACNRFRCGAYPGHTGFEFSSKGQKNLFGATSSMHCASSCSIPENHRDFGIDQTAAAATRHGAA
jgi:hypothetical protein